MPRLRPTSWLGRKTIVEEKESDASTTTQAAPVVASPRSQHFNEKNTNLYSPATQEHDMINSGSTRNSEESWSSDLVRNHKRKFISYKLVGEYEQPWKDHPRMKRTRINNYIVYGFMLLGLALAGLICFRSAAGITKYDYCLLYEDDFKTLNTDVWTREVQIDGFGTGSFDWTTTDSKNAFVDAEGLHIVPTLTNETTDINNDKLYNGYNLNLLSDGSCTSSANISCVISSNSTMGTMIPPVRSARLITKGKKSIRYGKIEVVAKLPVGDWLWPAIWMMPENETYGGWPKSGEIDIMESRGNEPGYVAGGRDIFTSALHWGMDRTTDSFWRTTNGREVRRTDFSKQFHTYGIEWTEDHIFTYLDTRLVQVLFTGFPKSSSLWQLGEFQGQAQNESLLQNPWVNSTSTRNAPFDQNFFLILNVAVGSRTGWFPDKKANKPWLDSGASAQWDFYRNANQWLPTWGKGNDRGMTVKSVKMWQQGKC